jgi:hypothetical protein
MLRHMVVVFGEEIHVCEYSNGLNYNESSTLHKYHEMQALKVEYWKVSSFCITF